MSTRSRIAYVANDGAVHSSHCHFDGYPEGVGATLHEHYQDDAKVAALIALGDMSSLEENVSPTGPHSYENRAKGVTVFYHRDRGEDLNTATDDSVDAMFSRASEGWEEYVYLRKNGLWFVSTVGGGAGPFLASAADPEGLLPANWKQLSSVLDGSDDLYGGEEQAA